MITLYNTRQHFHFWNTKVCRLPPITQHREHYCYLKYLTANSSYHKTFKSLTTNIMMLGISNTTDFSSAFDLHCNHVSDTEKPHTFGIQPTSQHSPQEAGVTVILPRCRLFSCTNLMMLPTLSCKTCCSVSDNASSKAFTGNASYIFKTQTQPPILLFICITLIWGPYMLCKCN